MKLMYRRISHECHYGRATGPTPVFARLLLAGVLLTALLSALHGRASADLSLPALPDEAAAEADANAESAPAPEAEAQPAGPLAEAGRVDAAADELAQARALVFGSSDPRAALCALCLPELPARHKLEQARELLDPGDASEGALAAFIDWLLIRSGRRPRAGEAAPDPQGALTALLASKPENTEACQYLAWIQAAAGRFDAARLLLRQGMHSAASPELALTRLELLGAPGIDALPLGLTGDRALDGADPARQSELSGLWSDLLARWPEHPAALRANADRIYFSHGSPAALDGASLGAAQQAYERVLSADPAPLDPERAYALLQQGLCLQLAGQPGAAAQKLRSSLRLRYRPETVGLLAQLSALADPRDDEGESAANEIWQGYLRSYAEDPGIWLAYGQWLEQRGDLEHALQQYQSACFLDDMRADCHSAAARCLLALGQDGEAQAELKRASELGAAPADALALARLQLEQQDFAGAEETLRPLQQQSPSDIRLIELRVQALSGLGRGAEALELLAGRLSDLSSSDPQLYLALGAAAEQAGDLNMAGSFYQRGLSFSAADYGLNNAYAALLQRQGQADALHSLLLKAQPLLAPRDFAAIVDKLALVWIKGQDYDTGSAFMHGLIDALPTEPTAYSELALLEAAQGRFDEALSSVKRGLNDAGDNYLGRYLEAYLTYRMNGRENALPLARALLSHPQVDANGYVLYLRLVEESADYLEQADRAREGLEHFPGHRDIFAFLARGLYFSGDTEAVIALLEDPANAAIEFKARHEMLGSAYLDEGNPVKAVALLRGALDSSPGNTQLMCALAQAHYALGEYPEARSLAQQALKLKPELSAAQLWLGFALEATGEVDLAAGALEQVVKSPLSTKEELAWAALGQARVALDRGSSAEAGTRLNEAGAYDYWAPYFQSELDRSRKDAGLDS